MLRGLGWNILRIWSTDWWFNAEEAIERIHLALNEALASSRAAAASEPHQPVMPNDDSVESSDFGVQSGSTDADGFPVKDDDDTPDEDNFRSDAPPAMPPESSERKIASLLEPVTQPADMLFATTDLSGIKVDPDCFFEFSYRSTLQAMVDAVMAAEAPVREDVLAQRVARAHG